jgi:hypothetical protein
LFADVGVMKCDIEGCDNERVGKKHTCGGDQCVKTVARLKKATERAEKKKAAKKTEGKKNAESQEIKVKPKQANARVAAVNLQSEGEKELGLVRDELRTSQVLVPSCPELSRVVPSCPDLSRLVPH